MSYSHGLRTDLGVGDGEAGFVAMHTYFIHTYTYTYLREAGGAATFLRTTQENDEQPTQSAYRIRNKSVEK